MKTRNNPQQAHTINARSGFALVGIIIAMVAVALISVAVMTMFSETKVDVATAPYSVAAQNLAEGGIRYAESQIAADPNGLNGLRDAMNGVTFTPAGANGTFTISSTPLDLRVSGDYAVGATDITLKVPSGLMPGGLSLTNVGVGFYSSDGATLKAQGRISSVDSTTAILTLETPGLTAALSDNDKVVAAVAPYNVWSTAVYSSGSAATTRTLSKAINTMVEQWGTNNSSYNDIPSNIDYSLFGVGNPSYGGVEYKNTKLTSSNLVMSGGTPITPNAVARHPGSGAGWKAAIRLDDSMNTVEAYYGTNWETGTPEPFTLTYNTTDGVNPDNNYVVHWMVGTPGSKGSVDLSYPMAAVPVGVDQVLSNFILAVQNYKDNGVHGYITATNIYVSDSHQQNVLQTDSNGNVITLDCRNSPNGYQALTSQNRQASTFFKITGSVTMVKQGAGNPPGEFGLYIHFYLHNVDS